MVLYLIKSAMKYFCCHLSKTLVQSQKRPQQNVLFLEHHMLLNRWNHKICLLREPHNKGIDRSHQNDGIFLSNCPIFNPKPKHRNPALSLQLKRTGDSGHSLWMVWWP